MATSLEASVKGFFSGVVAEFDSVEKVATKLTVFSVLALAYNKLVRPGIGMLTGYDVGTLGAVSHMLNRAEVVVQTTPQGLTELTSTGQLSKQNFLGMPGSGPQFDAVTGMAEQQMKRAGTQYLQSGQSSEALVSHRKANEPYSTGNRLRGTVDESVAKLAAHGV